MIIYQISLSPEQDVEAFVKFMNDEYFPAVHKGPTRVGQVTGLALLEGENVTEGDNARREFYLHADCGGLPVDKLRLDDEEVARKFSEFKADIKRAGFYREVAGWSEAAERASA